MNAKSTFLNIISAGLLLISWIVYASTIFLYIIFPIGNLNSRQATDRVWLQMLRSFYDNHFYLFVFLILLISVIVFASMLRAGKDIAMYKILFYSSALNFLFGIVGLFFKFAGHGQEIDGFEWQTAGGSSVALLVIWYMQATLLFLRKKPA